jgi:hypothetical protein
VLKAWQIVGVFADDRLIRTGYLLDGGLVLTAGYEWFAQATYAIEGFGGDRARYAGSVVWWSNDLGAAIIQLTTYDPEPDPAAGPRRWRSPASGEWVRLCGYADTTRPIRRWGRVSAAAKPHEWPWFAFTVSATTAPDGSWPRDPAGGVVLGTDGALLGFTIDAYGGDEANRVLSVPIGEMLADKRFTEVAGAYFTGLPDAHAPSTPLDLLLARPHLVGPAASIDLRPRSLAGPFRGNRAELNQLTRWCLDRNSAGGITVVAGAAGTGKTRVAAELCRALTAHGWTAGFAGEALANDGRDPVLIDRQALVVVDHAETAPIARIIERLSPGRSLVRIVLLTRHPDLAARPNQRGFAVELGVPDPEALRQIVGRTGGAPGTAVTTPLDAVLAGMAPTPSTEPAGLRRDAVTHLLDRWCAPVTDRVDRTIASGALALAMVVQPAKDDVGALLDHSAGPGAAAVEVLTPWLTGTFTGGFEQLDPIVGELLTLEGADPAWVLGAAVRWASSRPVTVVRVLRFISVEALRRPSLSAAAIAAVDQELERLARLAATSDSVRAALVSCANVVSDAEVATRWRTAMRVARDFEPITFAGLGDRPAHRDKLDREAFVAALAQVIRAVPDQERDNPDAGGPSVVAIDGPWGSGKTSLMRILWKALPAGRDHPTPRPRWRPHRFTVAEAVWRLRRRPDEPEPPPGHRPPLTWIPVWFNPWAHQSSEQLWAGLARGILDTVTPRLHPDPDDRARYWLDQNARRLDRPRLRRALVRNSLSPILRLAFFALFPGIAAALLRYDKTFHLLGEDRQATTVAVALVLLLLVAGVLHTFARLVLGRAEAYAPPGLLDAPVLSGSLADTAADKNLRDPLHHARSGYLYLIQHDIQRLLTDAAERRMGVVVFVDDLDRCDPQTTAGMLEAVNLFLSESFPAARFVLGLDMAVVAGHIDHTLKDYTRATPASDPSMGWMFLRKLVQLPVTLPRITPGTLGRLMDDILGPSEAPDEVVSVAARPGRSTRELPAATTVPAPAAAEPIELAEPADPELTAAAESVAARITRLERDPDIRERLHERLRVTAQPSAREAKRLLTVWQFYVRVLSHRGAATGAAEIRRARAMVLLAEIVVRWPALVAPLMTVKDGERVLTRLRRSAAGTDDIEWARQLVKAGIDQRRNPAACRDLRAILRAEDAHIVTELAEVLF